MATSGGRGVARAHPFGQRLGVYGEGCVVVVEEHRRADTVHRSGESAAEPVHRVGAELRHAISIIGVPRLIHLAPYRSSLTHPYIKKFAFARVASALDRARFGDVETTKTLNRCDFGRRDAFSREKMNVRPESFRTC